MSDVPRGGLDRRPHEGKAEKGRHQKRLQGGVLRTEDVITRPSGIVLLPLLMLLLLLVILLLLLLSLSLSL